MIQTVDSWNEKEKRKFRLLRRKKSWNWEKVSSIGSHSGGTIKCEWFACSSNIIGGSSGTRVSSRV